MLIRIRSKRHGFRRCGVAHSSDWVTHPDGRFDEDQIARLQAEPMLQVEVVEGEAGAEEKTDAPDGEDDTFVIEGGETNPAQRIIVAAKEAIKAGQVTKDGKPTVEAVEAILGIQITAEQRDQAWETIQAENGAEG
jgi:hypothetical protein